MTFPESFSNTGESPPFFELESSLSTATVKLSTSPSVCTPIPIPMASISFRRVSYTAGIKDDTNGAEGHDRLRQKTDTLSSQSTPASPQHRSRGNTNRMSQSNSMTSMMMLTRTKSKLSHNRLPLLADSHSMDAVSQAPGFIRSATRGRASTGGGGKAAGWFGKARHLIYDDIPEDQKLAFSQTKEAVLKTLKKVVGFAGEITLDVLLASSTVLEHVPIPWLQKIAETFINIWKAVQQVSMNRLAYLRLTQTCTTILDSIHKEIEASDAQVEKELSGPIAVLEDSFLSFLSTVQSQVDTPFLWRYVRREDTLKAIAACNDSLLKALALFTNTIQIRTLQAVCANTQICTESYQQLKIIADQIVARQCTHNTSHNYPTDIRRFSEPVCLPLSYLTPSPTIVSRSTDDLVPAPAVLPVLKELQTNQRLEAKMLDVEDLRRSMRGILDSGSDGAILSFLGIDKQDIPEAIKTLQRLREAKNTLGDGHANDTLHEEFVEMGIEALMRMSSNVVLDLPGWTITAFETDFRQRIGIGFFSEVYRGQWGKRAVAIKVLSEVTPSDLFIRETKVWTSLSHPNVLKLYGASSATGNPPWFFVSPYMQNGNLVEFLRRVSHHDPTEVMTLGSIAENLPSSKSRGSYGKGFIKLLKIDDTYRILQEIARGMEYLHQMGVLHGDFKASNVLVDDKYRCVISDFGQSEMKSEVCRITGSSMKSGTLRWKAPELLDGTSMLTPATDIYAYAIVCIEVFTMGELPWGSISDEDVRRNILEKDRRPMIPIEFTSPMLLEMIGACWHRDPDKRMPCSEVVPRLQRLRVIAGDGCDPSIMAEGGSWLSSPCLSNVSSFQDPLSPTPTPYFESVEYFESSDDFVALPSPQEVDALRMEDVFFESGMKMPEPVHYTVDMRTQPSLENSVYTSTTAADSEYELSQSTELDRRSPAPANSRVAEARNERRYRYLLEHEFNASLTLPLWEPSFVQIGDVGYLSKPSGAFVTLFNALKPSKQFGSSNIEFSPMASFGNISKGILRLDKRNVAQKGLDAFSEFLSFRSRTEAPISRRQSFRLRSGHKCAHIYTESAEYQYFKKLDAPKAWFRSHVEIIMKSYAQEHSIQKEDLFLVISQLQARDYAMFVSHVHPDGQAHFNVFSAPRRGTPWGTFTSDTNVPGGRNGPLYEEPHEHVDHDYATKVSLANGPSKAVLLGRLRFKPDSMEPTTAK